MRIAVLFVVLVLVVGCRDYSAPSSANLERTLTLSTSSGNEFVNPTDKQIHDVLSALDVGRAEVAWAILGRSEYGDWDRITW